MGGVKFSLYQVMKINIIDLAYNPHEDRVFGPETQMSPSKRCFSGKSKSFRIWNITQSEQ